MFKCRKVIIAECYHSSNLCIVLHFIDNITFECSGFQGLFGGILGPTLLDLQTRTDANKEEIAQAFIGKNVGSIAGSVFSGFLCEAFLKQTGTNVIAATYQSKMSNN